MPNVIIHIESGKITNIKAVSNFFRELKDGKYILEAKSYNKRSLNQNAYLWVIMQDFVLPGLRDAGWNHVKNKEDAHEFCKELFLRVVERNEKTGKETSRIKSTTELSKTEMMAYIEDIAQWSAEYLNVVVPPPNKDMELQFTNDFTNEPGKWRDKAPEPPRDYP